MSQPPEPDEGAFRAPRAEDIPSWMKKPPKSQRPITASNRVVQHVARERYDPMVTVRSGSRIATAGIVIIATLMAFTFWFWFGIGIAAGLNSPDQEVTVFGDAIAGSYVSGGRVFFGVVVAVIMTGVTWWVGMQFAESE